MFKNPLKYQSGGSLSQEQSAENQLINVIAEGLGAQPEQVRARLEQIKSNPKETQQLQQALQLMQKDKENGFKAILSLFAGKPQSAKFGGKIQDFICKHAKGGNLKGCGCKQEGGNVEKHQDANGKIGVTNGQYQASDWENEFNQFTPTPGGGYARNYRLPMFGGHRWGIPGNTLRQVLVTYGDNGIPRKAVRDLEGYYGNGKIDTVIYDARGNRHNSPEFEARVNRELAGMDPHQRPIEKENGGKVKKAQEGDIMLQPGEETVWDIKKDTLRNGTLESHKWAKNNSTLPRLRSEVIQWPGTYSRFIDGRDTILVRQTPMFNFYRSSLDPLHEIVTYSDGTPAGTNTYKTRDSWNKENQYHDKLK